MNDEELLKHAESLLHFGQPTLPPDNYIRMSMAISQLVIARNSVEQSLTGNALLAFTETGPAKKMLVRPSPNPPR